MKTFAQISLTIVTPLAALASISIAQAGDLSGCSFDGTALHGKVQEVSSFPDIKVQVVDSFPDLKVQLVDSFPSNCGQWQMVDSFPDFKVQFVDSFPDIKVQYVSSFPGVD